MIDPGVDMMPVGKGFRSINVGLRKGLELFASVRPVKTCTA